MPTRTEMAAFQEQLNGLAKEIARLSDTDITEEDFFRQFLERTVAVLGVGGSVWKINNEGLEPPKKICHMNLQPAGLEDRGEQFHLMENAVKKVLESSQAIVLPAQGGSDVFDGGLGEVGANKSDHTILFIPILVTNQVKAIFILISPKDVDPRAVRGYLGFVQGLCDRAGRFLQRRQIGTLEGQLAQGDRLRQFVSALHSSLDPQRACYALANYAQELLGVYRCMAGTFSSRGKFRMEAVSGVESLAVKSSYIQSISVIARQVCRNNKVLLVENPNAAVRETSDTGDDLVTAARLYMLQAKSMVLGIFPITKDDRVVGALVVEKASEEDFSEVQRRRIEGMLVEASSALSNCLTYRNLPLSLLVRSLGAVRDKVYLMPKARKAFWLSVVLLVLLGPAFLTKQVKVIGTAELVPIEARTAYVQQEGVIETVSVQSGQKVKKGEVLAGLDKRIKESEIDQITEALGEAQTAYLNAQGNKAEMEQLRYRRKSLEAELNKCKLQLAQYEITAPVSGTVVTRQSQIEQLYSKPVFRGEAVLEIVPDDSPWQLLVHVPEDEAGELLRAYDKLEGDESLGAKVILNAYPDKTLDTKVLAVARKAHVLSTGQQKYRNVIEVRVEGPAALNKTSGPAEQENSIVPRQGMEGKVAIECGKRNLYYVATHEFIDFLRVSLF